MVKVGDQTEKHVGIVWLVSTVDEQYKLFCNSETVREYTVLYTYYTIPSRMFFYNRRCCCVQKQTIQSCVNIWMSLLQ